MGQRKEFFPSSSPQDSNCSYGLLETTLINTYSQYGACFYNTSLIFCSSSSYGLIQCIANLLSNWLTTTSGKVIEAPQVLLFNIWDGQMEATGIQTIVFLTFSYSRLLRPLNLFKLFSDA